MRAIVSAIEAIAYQPQYEQAALSWAPAIARSDHGPLGAFMGYDFHLTPDGPKLIEINTNAGGAFLNAFLAQAQIACCAEVEQGLARQSVAQFERRVVEMFEAEWRRHDRSGALRRIAIVDDAPQDQYLYPEFVLAKRLFERHGYDAVIADPSTLHFKGDALQENGAPIDLVYNRLVDFSLDEPRHAALRKAYEGSAVVMTPNPRNHALFADKRNLTLLSDRDKLRAWGVDASAIAALSGVPRTVNVTRENADQLWRERKGLFFKPASGHASKAVYRGDKLTKGVWDNILASAYIAQDYAPPGERTIEVDGERVQRKVDVRLYTYAGEPLLAAARLYQGQTTNFRTAGGGFAPVFFI
jgi:glutathione synthase/RimK-type ligase-like ATP-grasp enzyme